MVRSTWDYHRRYPEFLAWIERASAVTRLLNPPDILRWNSDKSYLPELERKGIPVVATRWVGKGEVLDLTSMLREHGAIVVKPSVSASAARTAIFHAEEGREANAYLQGITLHDDAMAQPFLRSPGEYGEHSLLFDRQEHYS